MAGEERAGGGGDEDGDGEKGHCGVLLQKEQEDRMEELLLRWMEKDDRSGEVRAAGDEALRAVSASELAARRKARRMGFSADMILQVARRSERLAVDANGRIHRSAGERRQKTLKKMLEFWFGAANLRRDKFLSKIIAAAEDKMVPIQTLMKFNKVVAMNATTEELTSAIETCSDLLVLSPTRDKVGRKRPLEEEQQPEGSPDDRTVYIEPLPPNASHEEVSQLVQLLFHLYERPFSPLKKEFGAVEYISLPRFPDGEGKGFAFVEFFSPSSAARCVADRANKDAPSHAVDGDPPAAAAGGTASPGRGAWQDQLRVISKHQWLELKAKFKVEKRERKDRAKVRRQMDEIGYPVGVLARLEGLNADIKRQEIYEALETLSPVAYVEFKRSAPEGCYVRFHTPATARAAIEALGSGALPIGKQARKVTSAYLLQGQEEADKWDEILKETATKRKERSQKATGKEEGEPVQTSSPPSVAKGTRKRPQNDLHAEEDTSTGKGAEKAAGKGEKTVIECKDKASRPTTETPPAKKRKKEAL